MNFKSGGLHEKHELANYNLGTISTFTQIDPPKFSSHFTENTHVNKREDKPAEIVYRNYSCSCFDNSREHTNTACGRISEFLSVTHVVHMITTGLRKVNFT